MNARQRQKRAELLERQRTCPHDGAFVPDWAGILGWRYHCDKCGELMPGPQPTTWNPPAQFHESGRTEAT